MRRENSARSEPRNPARSDLIAYEELLPVCVLVLVGVEDVRVMLVEELRDRGDDPFAVRAGDEQDSGVLHR